MKTVNVEVWGGFHNTMRVLKLRLRRDERGGVIISDGQRTKIAAHICGFHGCLCGLRNIEVSGISQSEFNYAMVHVGRQRQILEKIMKIEQSVLENQYQGCGKAWAAIKDGLVVGLIYMSGHGIAEVAEVRKADKRFKSGFRVSYERRDTRDEFAAYRAESRRALAEIGEVVSGMCSCGEFFQNA